MDGRVHPVRTAFLKHPLHCAEAQRCSLMMAPGVIPPSQPSFEEKTLSAQAERVYGSHLFSSKCYKLSRSKNKPLFKAKFKKKKSTFFKRCYKIWSPLHSQGFQIPPGFSFVNILSAVSTIGFKWPAWLIYQRHLLLFHNNKSGPAWQLNSKSLFFESYALKVCQVINFPAVWLAK